MSKSVGPLFIVLAILLGGWFSINYLNKDNLRKNIKDINNIKINYKKLSSKATKNKFEPYPPSLDEIFNKDHGWIATLSAERVKTLLATGDIILGRSVNYRVVQSKNFNWPFEKTLEVLKNADITFINLESPLIKNCPLTNEGMIFCGDPRNVDGLVLAGVDVANLANNHLGDYGIAGINNTINLLKNVGILATGRPGPVFKDVKGTRFAFLGYNDVGQRKPGISWANKDKISLEISDAKSKSDIVVVAFHWGVEYTSQPTQRQRHLARLSIDSGADLVIGNHPHWIQLVEIYKNKLIVYAHGNFVFDQMWSEKTREGIIGRYTFYDKKLIGAEFLPVQIDNYGQPHLAKGPKKSLILDEMRKESIRLSSTPE